MKTFHGSITLRWGSLDRTTVEITVTPSGLVHVVPRVPGMKSTTKTARTPHRVRDLAREWVYWQYPERGCEAADVLKLA